MQKTSQSLLLFFITLLLFLLYNNYVQPLKDILAGEPYLDLKIGGYHLDVVRDFFIKLGDAGRALYVKTTLFDSVWPLMLAWSGFVFSTAIFTKKSQQFYCAFFPVAFGLLDLIENIFILTLLSQYPNITQTTVSLSSFFTVAKQIMIPGASIVFFAIPLVLGVRYYRKKTTNKRA